MTRTNVTTKKHQSQKHTNGAAAHDTLVPTSEPPTNGPEFVDPWDLHDASIGDLLQLVLCFGDATKGDMSGAGTCGLQYGLEDLDLITRVADAIDDPMAFQNAVWHIRCRLAVCTELARREARGELQAAK